MAKKTSKKDESTESENENLNENTHDKIIPIEISKEMKKSYINYAMSVITDRALPDARDGLKPVHRRILFSMHQNGLTSSARFRKSATVVGDVLGSYHPHGDSSVYDAMVNLAQDFKTRYPLIWGQGNFGSIDGDGAAAYRYTEAKMTKISSEMLRDIEKDTVDMKPNFDGTKKEPTILPTAVPNLLLNGTLGIAVGMATNIPPHNLGELIDASVHLIDNKDATTEDLCEFVQGPDFPTGGVIYGKSDIMHAYATGRGGILARGEADIVELKNGSYQIIITSIPYRVVKATLIERIADLVREKKIEGIKGLRDESTKDIRIAIDLKTGIEPQKVLNYLYKHTQLEDTFHVNLVCLVDGVPQTLNLKSSLEEFIKHRQIIVKRRTEFELKKATDREHILLGLKKALDHIDEIIKLIRKSKTVEEAKTELIKQFKFTEIQAQAILDMKLQRLAGLERKKIEDELKAIQELIKELQAILASDKKMLKIIKDELLEIRSKYSDERRTKVVKHKAKDFNPEDLIADKEAVLVYTAGGYVKRTDPDEFKTQKRGGVGVVDLNTKEEDFITMSLTTSTHSDLLFFTDKGKVYQIKMYDLPEGKRATRGKSIMNYLQIASDEKVTSILPMPKDIKNSKVALVMITRDGTVKKSNADAFKDVRRSGLIAIKLKDDDVLLSTLFVEKGDDVILTSVNGQSIRFAEEDVRAMGRTAGGVRGMKLGKKDEIASCDVIKKDLAKESKLLVATENGYGKMTKLTEYKTQGRGGSGIKTVSITEKTGKLMVAKVVVDEERELLAISKNSQVIKTELNTIPTLGRATQGVRIMKLRDKDSVASIAVL
ncbi:DNA gyrase subunit A [bioreactor metagenome]|uniref:DNA topoisomerase (ATP-hydrolyzing) n=1 Tax=bioreactor metagenome TaxID=1076179 RepID=A0A644V7E6_9ZZZZ|nr:DNA gyrase subunit A [Candidatus Elulimicrobiales bacterium]